MAARIKSRPYLSTSRKSLKLSGDQTRALIATLLGVALATLDTAVANTALPAIADALHSGHAASIWVINAYQLAVVATLLPFAALGDRWGPRRIFLGGLLFFTLASLVCALADSLWTLTIARAMQGLGAAAMMSVNIALIRLIFPPEHLGRGVGFNALVVGLGFTVGPSIASIILSVATWPWLFAINVPLGVLALAFAVPALPRVARGENAVNPLTSLLTAITFGSLILGLGAAAQQERFALVATPLAIAAAAGALLLWREAGHPAPMVPIDLFRRPLFTLSVLTGVAAFITQGLAFVGLPFYFEGVLHRNPVQTGFLMTAWPLVVALLAPIAGRLSDRYPPGLLGGVGLAILSVGMALLALMPIDTSAAGIALRMAICGLGFGLFQSPNLKAMMSAAPPHRSGGASGVIAMARLIGQASGAALVALCFGLAGAHGPLWALALGAGSAALACMASTARLWAR